MVMHTAYLKTKVNQFDTGIKCGKIRVQLICLFSFEKLHHKFCKAVLGIKKTSCIISAKSEFGRLPLDSFIKTQVMLYYSRIQLDGINPLVKEAFNINKNISNENIYTFIHLCHRNI
jgi:hypothetical protein